MLAELGRFAAHGLTPAVLTGVELGRFAAHGLTPAVLTGVELGRFAAHGLTPSTFRPSTFDLRLSDLRL